MYAEKDKTTHIELRGGTVEENSDGISISPKKLEANRRNAQLSTGPRTEQGKSWSRLNSTTHGILASALLITEGEGAEDLAEFDELLGNLYQALEPVGALEEMLVEKIAVHWWKQRRALQCEAGLIRRAFASKPKDFDEIVNTEREAVTDHHCLPLGAELDRILRYETANQRQLAYTMNQLERLQRARKGEHVPAPVSAQVSGDQ
jgi:hypothetical protein